jgi:DNA topoisomerase VI subunit B
MSGAVPTFTLRRETFELSRTLEFFSEKELTAQMGFTKADWPVALFKELLDNALDACESAHIPPVITVELYDDALVVADNGPGLPLATLQKSLDYTLRYSDKLGYVSSSRGQQGNALKILWAAPFAATGEGRIEVETADYRREVRVTLDRIAQVPKLELLDTGDPKVKTGTKITLHWVGIAWATWMVGTSRLFTLRPRH